MQEKSEDSVNQLLVVSGQMSFFSFEFHLSLSALYFPLSTLLDSSVASLPQNDKHACNCHSEPDLSGEESQYQIVLNDVLISKFQKTNPKRWPKNFSVKKMFE